MIIDHTHIFYRRKWALVGNARYNGAYYYSNEIVDNIIPNVKTKRPWVTINVAGACTDHAIVFIHNNIDIPRYEWLKDYKDLVLVCGVPETCNKVAHLGKAIYLPLSIDTEYVKSYKVKKKTKEVAFVGRTEKKTEALPKDIDYLVDMPRHELLTELAKYKKVYAVGRCALEAKALDCEILPYDPRYGDVDFWEVLDNKEAVRILQEKLDEIDKPKKGK